MAMEPELRSRSVGRRAADPRGAGGAGSKAAFFFGGVGGGGEVEPYHFRRHLFLFYLFFVLKKYVFLFPCFF